MSATSSSRLASSVLVLLVLVWSARALAVDCNGNGVNDPLDISGGTSADCNVNAIPDECDLAGGGSADCNGDGVPDECTELTVDVVFKGDAPSSGHACTITTGDAGEVTIDLYMFYLGGGDVPVMTTLEASRTYIVE